MLIFKHNTDNISELNDINGERNLPTKPIDRVRIFAMEMRHKIAVYLLINTTLTSSTTKYGVLVRWSLYLGHESADLIHVGLSFSQCRCCCSNYGFYMEILQWDVPSSTMFY